MHVLTRRRCACLAAALALTACGGEKISKPDAAATVQASSAFKATKVAYLSRVIAIPADSLGSINASSREGSALTILEIASVDPVIALLKARDQIEIEDFVSAVQSSIVQPPKPVADTLSDSAKAVAQRDSMRKAADTTRRDSTKGNVGVPLAPPPPKPLNSPQTSPPPALPLARQWVHTLRVTPRARPEMADLSIDEGGDSEDAPRPVYSGRPIGRVPGWTLALGAREFVKVLEVSERPHGSAPGEIVVDFLWRWRATRAGALFDADGAEFRSLPSELQQAVQAATLTIDTSDPQWSRATLARNGKAWRVTAVDWTYGAGKPHDPW